MAKMDELFVALRDLGGSDLHLVAGLEPRIRAKGALQSVPDWDTLDHETLRSMMREITTPEQWKAYDEDGDLDFAYELESVGRFRSNFFNQHRGAGAIFRIIPSEIIPMEKLRLPPSVEELTKLERGLVLVTGPTGSGKSTTLAAIIDRINNISRKHIVTIEDPIEFVHPNKKCVFSQREVGRDTESFGAALRSAIRQDANVVLVGEMRDYETISLALSAAEMGVLVFGTLHTNNAAKTIDRLIDAFPAQEHAQVRTSLSESVAAIVCQLLLPTSDGKGRCAVNEILVRNNALPNIIREGNTHMINSMIQGGKSQGMQLMDEALVDKAKARVITAEAALSKATDRTRVEAALKQLK